MDYLRIRAYLRTPVVSDAWLPLDGILLSQYTRDDLGNQDISIAGGTLLADTKGNAMRGGRLPIAIIHARDWYYCCSWAQWSDYTDGQDAWVKRFDTSLVSLIDFNGRRGRIDTSAGTYKAYHMPVYYRSALWVEWYARGEREKLEPIIYTVTHLGKKTVQGWGRVARWEIAPMEEDWSVWKGNQLMRGIPIYHWRRELGTPKLALYGVRPSYWDTRNQMELVVP